jgi:hypothetical protein
VIASTINLFCYYNLPGCDEEILYGFKHHKHLTKEVTTNKALHSFIVYKDCYRIFYDQWKESEMIQSKFLDHIKVPDIPELPSNCKRFSYNELPQVANYIQRLTGFPFYPKIVQPQKFKRMDVMPEVREKLREYFKEYNERIGIEYYD